MFLFYINSKLQRSGSGNNRTKKFMENYDKNMREVVRAQVEAPRISNYSNRHAVKEINCRRKAETEIPERLAQEELKYHIK